MKGIYVIGLIAQLFFSGRMLVQWVLSERKKEIVSPTLYWVFSLIGSYLLCIYGWLRDDFSIILGQFISFYVYVWNLDEKCYWKCLPAAIRVTLIVTPLCAAIFALHDIKAFIGTFLQNESIPLWLVLLGSLGQVIFTLRFVYQWYYSRKKGESVLPVQFWVISLVGSLMIALYGIIRLDPILILGQSTGFIVYLRNIILGKKSKEQSM